MPTMRGRGGFAAAAAAGLSLAALTASTARASPAGMVTIAPLWGPPTSALLARVGSGQVGGVILLGRYWTSADVVVSATKALQASACRTGTPLLIGVDQEGGAVRRLPWAAPAPAAAHMTTTDVARGQAAAAARDLRGAGIAIDFAPVADVAVPGSFLGTRAFGTDPALVAPLASAFVSGLQSGGVAATAKHFPGLGSAIVSTDDRPVTIGRSAAFLDSRLAPFRWAIAAGAKLVMVSSASYPALDATGTPAVFSRPIVSGLLREELGFGGLVVTDALDAPAAGRTPHAAARAIAAGVDLLLYSRTLPSERGYASLVADASRSASLRADLSAAGRRIAALKSWLGVACTKP
jgi:beta-N-acetylhexosaminidase